MNYLHKNLDKSMVLPYDIMLNIFEYLDPLFKIRSEIFEKIKNRDYDLDEIMYKRAKKYIVSTYDFKTFNYFLNDDSNYGLKNNGIIFMSERLMITNHNLNNLNIKHLILKDYKFNILKNPH